MFAVGAAALGAGCVNAIAGGGSLITFPALVAVGLSPVMASATNTVALCPGYLGATLAQRTDLAGQRARLVRLLPLAACGGVAGALLLLRSGDAAFTAIVPFLILLASLLLAVQPRVARLVGRAGGGDGLWVVAPVSLAAIYGGYFGAGMGVMILAALAIALADTLVRLNALKQAVSLSTNLAAAAVFVATGRVDWAITGVMLGGALAGGAIGGRIASRVPNRVLRWVVVTLGLALSGYYLSRFI
ncbi:MAG: sulfite exporter TauE/SafE family protein [Deltaproteobacteria bacterium]|nr:sulfite exporter TauE/SafE family protein [Deltaproteobacteria bacterium]